MKLRKQTMCMYLIDGLVFVVSISESPFIPVQTIRRRALSTSPLQDYEVRVMTVFVSRGSGAWGARMLLWRSGKILRVILHGMDGMR